MSADDKGRGPEAGRSYVAKVLDDTQRYTQDLLAENDSLRQLVRSLEDDRVQLVERNSLLTDIERENHALQDLLASIQREKLRLEQQLVKLREDEARRSQEQQRLREELAAFEDRSRRLTERSERIEHQNSSLANLYAATYQLHCTLDTRTILSSIHEILGNLVGSEQTLVLEPAANGRQLVATSANGVDPRRLGSLELGQGVIGRAAAQRELLLVGPGGDGEPFPEQPELRACIPLTLEEELVGVIVIFELLPQKPAFEALDRELFALLATHAATALYSARLRERLVAPPAGVR